MELKKSIILILIVMIILGMSITVNAADTADTYKINLTAANNTVKQGEIVTLSLNISDIDIKTGEKGIGAYEGTIEYDKNVFEELKMLGNDNWDKPGENEGVFTSVNADGLCVKEAQEIAKITLKAKTTAKVGNTTIKIKGFKASNLSPNMIPTDDTSIEVTVSSASNSGSDNLGGNGSGSGSGTSSGQGQTQTQQKPQQTQTATTTTANKKLPHAGKSSIMAGILIIIAGIGIFSYIRYKTIF